MARNILVLVMAAFAGLVASGLTGCIPVTPYKHKSYEDKFYVHERYARVPILGPIVPGGPVTALDPPSDVHASADYRRSLAETSAVRAVLQATERAKG